MTDAEAVQEDSLEYSEQENANIIELIVTGKVNGNTIIGNSLLRNQLGNTRLKRKKSFCKKKIN
jgi:hypothetical protein